TSFATVCFPPHAGIGPVRSSFKIIAPSSNSSYSLNKPLLISWKGFLVQDNPNLLIQLWREDTCINKYPKRIAYKKSHVSWKNALTESGSGYYIRIFRADNECIN
ncbi:38688_t:CDS:2, partial [Gigaspora margarita]